MTDVPVTIHKPQAPKPLPTTETYLPRAPKLHRFERDGRVVLYNAFTHQWRVFDAPMEDACDDLAEIDWEFLPLSALEAPHLMRVEVTQQCNFQCQYCIVFENDLAQLHTSMSMETAERLLEYYHRTMPGGTIMLIGGEPTLNWDVCKAFYDGVPLEAGKELYTNAIRLSDDDIAYIKDRRIEVRLSLDGFERHHKQRLNRGGRTMYDRIVERFGALRDAGVDVGINCTVTPLNLPDLVDIHQYFVGELGARHVNYSIPHMTVNSGVTDGFDMDAYTDAMLVIYEDAKRNHVFVAQIMKRLAYLVRERFKAIGCTVIGPEVTFYPDGKRTLCTTLDSHANTASVRPDEIYAGLPFFMEDCRRCPAIGVCGGGCYWDAKMRFDRFQDLRECRFQQRLIEQMLWDVVDWSKDTDYPKSLNAVFGTEIF